MMYFIEYKSSPTCRHERKLHWEEISRNTKWVSENYTKNPAERNAAVSKEVKKEAQLYQTNAII